MTMAVSMKPVASGEEMLPRSGEPYDAEEELWAYLRIISRRRLWLLLGIGIMVCGAVAYNLTATPIYGASAKVLVPPAQVPRSLPSGSDMMSFLPNPLLMGFGSELNTQATILQSKPMTDAALSLLQRHPEFIEPLTSGKKRRLSDSDLRNLMTRFSLTDPPKGRVDPELFRIAASVSVSPIEGTNILQIRATSPNITRSHDYVNALSVVYLIGALERTQRVARSLGTYIAEKIAEVEQRLRRAELALAEFNERAGSIELSSQAQSQLTRLAALRGSLVDARKELAAKRAELATTQAQLGNQHAEVIQSRTTSPNPVRDILERRLAELNVERNSLLAKYQPDSTKVRAVEAEIAAVKAQLQKQDKEVASSTTRAANPVRMELVKKIAETQAEIRAQQAAIATLERAVRDAEAELARMPGNAVQLARLQRERELAEKQYVMLRQKQEEYRLAQESQISGAELLEPAVSANAVTISPRRHLNLIMGLMAGLLFGIVLALIAEYVDDTYPDARSAERDLGLGLIGVIPRTRNVDLIHTDNASRSMREAFLSLWSNIGFASPGGPPGTIMVTSGQPYEGKTTIACNLAVAAAESDRQVVIVDADLRRPRVHEVLGVSQTAGLSNILAGQAQVDGTLQRVLLKDGLELHVISSGPVPPTPQALLDSAAMDGLLKELRGRGYFVVLDAPPVGEVSDAQILGSKVEAALLVFTQRGTRRPILRSARSLLFRAGANVIGLVLNRATPDRGWRSYATYYDDAKN